MSTNRENLCYRLGRAAPGPGLVTKPLASKNYWSGDRKVWFRTHKEKAFYAAISGVAQIDDRNRVHRMVDEVAKFQLHSNEFHCIEVAYENRVLHRPTETLHRLVNLAKTLVLADVVPDEVAAPTLAHTTVYRIG